MTRTSWWVMVFMVGVRWKSFFEAEHLDFGVVVETLRHRFDRSQLVERHRACEAGLGPHALGRDVERGAYLRHEGGQRVAHARSEVVLDDQGGRVAAHFRSSGQRRWKCMAGMAGLSGSSGDFGSRALREREMRSVQGL